MCADFFIKAPKGTGLIATLLATVDTFCTACATPAAKPQLKLICSCCRSTKDVVGDNLDWSDDEEVVELVRRN